MNIRKSLLVQLTLIAIAAVYSLSIGSKLPETVPIHWNASGHVDGYGSKWVNLLVMPGMMFFMLALTWVLPKLSPKKFEIEPFEATYSYMMVLVNGMMLCIHIAIVQASSGAHLDITKLMMVILFAFFALMGNVLGKLKPNFYMGIRTPWTLSNEQVWHITHRFAGRLWVIGGVVGIFGAILGAPFWASFTYLMVISFAPIVKSFIVYKNLGPS